MLIFYLNPLQSNLKVLNNTFHSVKQCLLFSLLQIYLCQETIIVIKIHTNNDCPNSRSKGVSRVGCTLFLILAPRFVSHVPPTVSVCFFSNHNFQLP